MLTYYRGKSHSHDVDLLLSHESSTVTGTLLETLLSHFKTKVSLLVVSSSEHIRIMYHRIF